MKATHKASGRSVSADEETLRRLGPGWEVEKSTPAKQPAKKAADKKSD